MELQAIRYTRGSLEILDQLRLPHQSIYVQIKSCSDAFSAIKRMVVRGAPAIAIVAALALAVELHTTATTTTTIQSMPPADIKKLISVKLDYLVGSRPTAVNLSDAVTKLKRVVISTSDDEVVERYIEAAEKMLVDDVADNKNIGEYGAKWILSQKKEGGSPQVAVLTHCNTGFETLYRTVRVCFKIKFDWIVGRSQRLVTERHSESSDRSAPCHPFATPIAPKRGPITRAPVSQLTNSYTTFPAACPRLSPTAWPLLFFNHTTSTPSLSALTA
jgi:hypothetical protein